MNNKFLACLEITNVALKLLIGYELNGKPVVVYTHYLPLEKGTIQHDEIKKPDALAEALKSISNITEQEGKLEIKLVNVNLVIPSIGLKVYQSEKSFAVVTDEDKVGDADITNLISLLQKERIPDGNVISNIIPIAFQLDDGRRFATPPLGFTSKSIMVKAMIHTLPESMRGAHALAVNGVGIRVLKSNVSVYCAAKFYATMPGVPKSYLFLDFGAGSSDLALIGDTEPYAATSFAKGGQDLTQAIADAFGISFEDAENLKINNGYKEVKLAYRPVLIRGYDQEGNPKNYYQEDLNRVIASFFEVYCHELRAGLGTFLERYAGQGYIESLPMIVGGGGAKLVGLEKFLSEALPGRDILAISPDIIGARDPSMVNLLGMLMCAGSYSGSKEDISKGVATVTRENPTEKRKNERRKTSRSSIDEDL